MDFLWGFLYINSEVFFLLIKIKLYVFVILENFFEILKVLFVVYIVNIIC